MADWNAIPGAHGGTPQACGFRDIHAEPTDRGVRRVHGLPTRAGADRRKTAARRRLPFTLLSDVSRAFAMAARLPTVGAGGAILLRRLTLVIDDGIVTMAFRPVFPPDRSAAELRDWLGVQRRAGAPAGA